MVAPTLSIQIKVDRCENLKDEFFLDKADPYVVVTVAGQSQHTRHQDNVSSPVYNETFTFNVDPLFFSGDDNIKVEVWDHNSITANKCIGTKETNFAKLLNGTNVLLLDDPRDQSPGGECVIELNKKEAKAAYEAYLAYIKDFPEEAKESKEAIEAEAASKALAASAVASAVAQEEISAAKEKVEEQVQAASAVASSAAAAATSSGAAAAAAAVPKSVPTPAPTPPPPAAPVVAAAAAAAPPPAKGPVVTAAPPAEPLYLGISLRNWGIIVAILLTLYLCVALFYASLMTIAIEARADEYIKLPSVFFGDFDREYYYEGFGQAVDSDEVPLYPWIWKSKCSGNTFADGTPNTFVCTPQCDNLIYSKCNSDCQELCVLP